jgi:hypothetical protein
LDQPIDRERREQSCRRRGEDGGGSRADHVEVSESVRAYTFRSFSDRRGCDDRRYIVGAAGRRATDRQEQCDQYYDADFVDLSSDEVLALMHNPEK